MGVGTSGAHFRRDPNCLDKLLLRRAMPHGRLRVPFDAVGTLRDVRHGNGNDLLHLDG